jgi:predicted dehydrogenase
MNEYLNRPIRLMTVDPGHFHAALVQKRTIPGIHHRSYIYAPLGRDLERHLRRLTDFNQREHNPTAWELDIRSGSNYWERFLQEQPGNTVVLSGRNKPKIDRILAAVQHGLNVLADKPWIVDASDFPKLEQVFREATLRDRLVWDMMTERHETVILFQQALLRNADIFGEFLAGTPEEPSLTLESLHHLKKTAAGGVLQRPVWWFDPSISGEGLADVGTHLFDLALLFVRPESPVTVADVQLLDAQRGSLHVTEEQFSEITGAEQPSDSIRALCVHGNQLQYFGNGRATFTLDGRNIRVTTRWEVEAEPGAGDGYEIVARGTRSTVVLSHDPTFGSIRSLSITPNRAADFSSVHRAVAAWVASLQVQFPGLSVVNLGESLHLHIPDEYRRSHETLFSLVVQDFVTAFHDRRQVAAWEEPNHLTRYHLSTQAVELARRNSPTTG